MLHRPTGSRMDHVVIVLPGLARLTGAGTIGPHNDLNFAMKAHVDISKSAVGMIGSALGSKNNNVDVPIHITGTTRDPPDTSRPLAVMRRLSDRPEVLPRSNPRG